MTVVINGTTGYSGPVGVLGDLTTTGNTILGDASTDTLNVANGNLVLDSTGDLGLGVTPSAWGSNVKAFQVTGSALSRDNNADAKMVLSNNAYRENGSVWKYIGSAAAVMYQQGYSTGDHQWYTAPSGTAGNAITFTQAMTLDSTTSSGYTTLTLNGSTGGQVLFAQNGSAKAYIYHDGTVFNIYNNVSGAITFSSGGTERARIDSSGRLTTPYQPSFSAYNPEVTGSGAIVRYSGVRSNVGSHYNASTGVFTAPIAGVYFFTFNALMNVNGDYVRLLFRWNGTASTTYGDTLSGGTNGGWNSGWSYISIGMSWVISLGAGDTISVWNDGPTATWGGGYGSFSGYMLG